MPSANMAAKVGRSDRCLYFKCLSPREAPKCIHGSDGMARHGLIETNSWVANGGIVHVGGAQERGMSSQQGHLPGRVQRQHTDCCADVVQRMA